MRRRGVLVGLAFGLVMACGFGLTGAPYYRVGPGPVLRVGPATRGSWLVTTVRVQNTSWFQWADAQLTGGRLVRVQGSPAPSSTPAASVSAQQQAMDGSQTAAVLVASQLAAARSPLGTAWLQVTSAASGFQQGDVILAAGDGMTETPLRAPTDLEAVAEHAGGDLRVLVVPKEADGSWGAAESRHISGARLTALPISPYVAAVAYPLGVVEGPSAGLILSLARLDALESGRLAAGRRIAGTGAINVDGTVTTVADVDLKAKAALSSGATVFFVPQFQRDIAIRAARGSRMKVVGVSSVTEAVRWLCHSGGSATLC